tara:strand:+ start:22 stop:657 length:636 start_codon:yes stop_codon:yes gene_type:complete
MSKYGYIGKDGPTQAVKSNAGVLNPKEHRDLIIDDKLFIPGQLELIETKTADDSVAFYDFDSLGKYDIHFLTANNIQAADSTAQNLDIRVKVAGVVQTSGYKFGQLLGNSAGTFANSESDSYSQFIWLSNVDNEADASANGYSYIYHATDPSKYTFQTFQMICEQDVHQPRFAFGGGAHTLLAGASGLRVFLPTAGNIALGTISLYGIKEY